MTITQSNKRVACGRRSAIRKKIILKGDLLYGNSGSDALKGRRVDDELHGGRHADHLRGAWAKTCCLVDKVKIFSMVVMAQMS